MPPGRGAEWDDAIKTFFPPSNDGAVKVAETRNKLLDLEALSTSYSEGIWLLISKLMQLSSLINADAPQAVKPSLGAGLVIRNNLLD